MERRPVRIASVCAATTRCATFLRRHALGHRQHHRRRRAGYLDVRRPEVHRRSAAGRFRSPRCLVPIAAVVVQRSRLQASVEETPVPRLVAVGAGEKIQRARCRRRQFGVLLAAALQSRSSTGSSRSARSCLALFACAWVLRARNVLGIMGWHAGWNWLLAVGFGLPLTRHSTWAFQRLFGRSASRGEPGLAHGRGGRVPRPASLCLAAYFPGHRLACCSRRGALLRPGKSSIASCTFAALPVANVAPAPPPV